MPNFASVPQLLVPVAAAFLTLSACTQADSDPLPETRTPTVLTTFTVLEDMVTQVGGEHVEVRSITPRGAEVHEYDPTPSDIRSAAEADLVIENGLGLEEWFEQFIQHAEAPSATATEGIDTVPVTRLVGHPDDAGSDDDMPVNPHAWMSPLQAQGYIDNIEAALTEHFPEDAEAFAQNAEDYRQQLEEIHQEAAAGFEALDSDAHLVTCEGAFSYLSEEYGLGEHYLWPLNAENEGTAAQTQAQVDYVETNEVPVVFCESTVNDSAQQQVAAETGAELGEPLHVDSLTGAEGPAPTYLELLRYDIDLVLSAYE